jgi:thioredoxin-dependent peroxiredoxin
MIQEGDLAIDFTLEASNGEKVSLSDFRGKPVVLYFYPKDLTPGCTTQACDFRDYHEEFSKLDAVILGIGRDPVRTHQRFVEKYQLPFLLLSDPAGEVCQAYGVLKEKTMFGKKVMGIERTTFLINRNGKVVKIYRKVKVKDHVKEALEFVKTHMQ